MRDRLSKRFVTSAAADDVTVLLRAMSGTEVKVRTSTRALGRCRAANSVATPPPRDSPMMMILPAGTCCVFVSHSQAASAEA